MVCPVPPSLAPSCWAPRPYSLNMLLFSECGYSCTMAGGDSQKTTYRNGFFLPCGSLELSSKHLYPLELSCWPSDPIVSFTPDSSEIAGRRRQHPSYPRGVCAKLPTLGGTEWKGCSCPRCLLLKLVQCLPNMAKHERDPGSLHPWVAGVGGVGGKGGTHL